MIVIVIRIIIVVIMMMMKIIFIINNKLTYRKIKHRRTRRRSRKINPFHGIFDAVGVRKGVAHPARYFVVICFFGEGCGVGLVEGSDETFAEAQHGGFGR